MVDFSPAALRKRRIAAIEGLFQVSVIALERIADRPWIVHQVSLHGTPPHVWQVHIRLSEAAGFKWGDPSYHGSGPTFEEALVSAVEAGDTVLVAMVALFVALEDSTRIYSAYGELGL